MRRVRLQCRAFLDNALCEAGSVVEIGDDAPLASYMTLLPAPAVPKPVAGLRMAPTQHKTVTVHEHQATGEIDIDVDGVEMKVENATLKVEND